MHGQLHSDLSLLYRARRRVSLHPTVRLFVITFLHRSLVFSQGTWKVAPIAR